MSLSFLEHISDIEDPRIPGMTTYPLNEILLTVFIGMLCKLEDLEEIEDFCAIELAWLRRYLPFANGIAPAQTLRRTLARLEPRHLEKAFTHWAASLTERIRGVIAIDGKAVRGSKQEADGAGALHLVSAWAHEAGLVLAQVAVDKKSNEITAIPELLEMLDCTGTIITIDAMGTQKAIADKIIAKGADYVLALKGNQETLVDDVKLYFADPVIAPTLQRHETVDSDHGRIEERTIVTADAAWLAQMRPEWQGLKSIAAITEKRMIKKTGKTSIETRYFITSLPSDPKLLAETVRAHWGVENNLHWCLDMAFREDESRMRKDHSPHNLATIRRVALNIMKLDPMKKSIKRKRLRASLDRDYREQLLCR